MEKAIILLCLCLLLCSCDSNSNAAVSVPSESPTATSSWVPDVEKPTDPNVLEIRERFFVQTCNDIYLNTENYKDTTIKIEGRYDYIQSDETGMEYHSVTRMGPGCCGYDGLVGFNFVYPDTDNLQLDDWIEVIGKPKESTDVDGTKLVTIEAISVRVLDVRGAETVFN